MVDRLCTSLGGLSLSAIRRYTALAAEREDCITLTIGEPDLPTPAPICEAAVRRAVGDKPIFILCDDVYRGLCTRPCPDPAALPGLRERLLIAQSFSKPWAMTGWRIGYLMGSAPVIRKLKQERRT